jgi:hypothetical protein
MSENPGPHQMSAILASVILTLMSQITHTQAPTVPAHSSKVEMAMPTLYWVFERVPRLMGDRRIDGR